jgi:CPA1 family monovalent cation:H+ antiporter
LFNDGVGVVIFITILNIAGGDGSHGGSDFADIIILFGQEVLGGIIMGGLLGFVTYRLIKSIDDYDIEVLITLACVMGGYSLGHYLHVSAPLAMVVAGLIVGNDTIRDTSMSDITEQYVDKFWELIDILLNAVLFVLIGLEMLILSFENRYIIAGILCIVLVLLARYASLIIPVRFFSKRLDFAPNTSVIMTWGGLRGGISIALALSLPEDMNRDLFLMVTYIVVVFSIVVQGLTIGKLAKKLIPGISKTSS